ncbi:MAG: hypothetical protein U0228_10105 [Myxococcaceae bacterium]
MGSRGLIFGFTTPPGDPPTFHRALWRLLSSCIDARLRSPVTRRINLHYLSELPGESFASGTWSADEGGVEFVFPDGGESQAEQLASLHWVRRAFALEFVRAQELARAAGGELAEPAASQRDDLFFFDSGDFVCASGNVAWRCSVGESTRIARGRLKKVEPARCGCELCA